MKTELVLRDDNDELLVYNTEGYNIILTGCKRRCTRCGHTKPLTAFGMRRMPSATMRIQPQCTECRNET